MKTIAIAKGACAASALLALGSVLVFGPLGVMRERKRVMPVLTDDTYASANTSDMATNIVRWTAPTPSSRDAAWTYEVFTPPEIHYDGSAQKYTAAPQQTKEASDVASLSGFGLELLEVRRVPFRLQLVGYVGEEGSYLGTFENLESAETFLARAGRQLPELGLAITDFSVRRESVVIPQSASVVELVATATVRDLRTTTETVLRHSERSYTEQLYARLRGLAESGEYEAAAGDAIHIGGVRYVIEKLRLDPPAAEVRREVAGDQPAERRVLSVAPIL